LLAHKNIIGAGTYISSDPGQISPEKNQALNIKIFSLQQKKSEIAGEKSEETKCESEPRRRKKKLKLNHVANVEEIKLNEN
jgi:hypothetical protein